MVHRIHNRNTGYSENSLTSNNNVPISPSLDSFQGATALKLDEEIKTEQQIVGESQKEKNTQPKLDPDISLDNAAYFENNTNIDQTHKDEVQEEVVIEDISIYEENPSENIEMNSKKEDDVPQLFSDEVKTTASSEDNSIENIKNEEEEFEIPAFLRKQKF